MTEFKVPELGENVAGGDVTSVLVKVGDTIAREQPVLELETDKATIEVPSSVAGVVKEITRQEGRQGQGRRRRPDGGRRRGAATAPARPTGRRPKAEPPTAERRSRRAAAEAAEQPSRPSRGRAEAGRAEHKVAADAAAAGAPSPPAAPAAAAPARAAGAARARPPAPASPAVRRLAREIGVDVNEVQGTGPGGRISQDDVKEHARRILSSVGAPARRPAAPRRARAAAARLPEVGRGRAPAVEQHPARDGRASELRLEHDSARHAVRQGRRHRARGAAEEVQGAGREGRRQPDGDRHAGAGAGHRGQEVPAVQRVDRHRARRDRLQEVRERRRGGGHRSRPARAGHPQRRPEEHHADRHRDAASWPRRRATGS